MKGNQNNVVASRSYSPALTIPAQATSTFSNATAAHLCPNESDQSNHNLSLTEKATKTWTRETKTPPQKQQQKRWRLQHWEHKEDRRTTSKPPKDNKNNSSSISDKLYGEINKTWTVVMGPKAPLSTAPRHTLQITLPSPPLHQRQHRHLHLQVCL